MANDAIFNEVIAVEFDQAAFQKQLDALVERYQSALGKMGEGAPGFLATLNTATFNEQLQELQGNLTGFAQNFSAAFDSVAAEIAAQMNKVAADSSTTIGQATKAVQKFEEATALDVRTKVFDELEGQYAALLKDEQILADAKKKAQIDEAALVDLTMAKYEQLAAARQASYDAYDAKINNARAKQNAASNKQEFQDEANERKAINDQLQADIVARNNEALAEQKRALQEYVAFVKEQYEAAKQVAREAPSADRFVPHSAKEEIGTNRLASSNALSDLKEQIQAAEAAVKSLDGEAAKAAADEAARLREVVESASQASAAINKAFDPRTVSGFFKSLIGDVAQLAVGVIRFQVAWTLVGTAIQGVLALIKAPFEAIANGVDYLNKLNQVADELAGVLQANVKYSGDLAQNFKIAQEQAQGVAVALRDISIKDNLKPDALQNSFKALIENGVMNYVSTTQQAVQLTEDLNVAIKASGASVETTRRIQSEIPKLLSGQVTGHEKILSVLHMSATEWQNMLASAQQHKDLADALAPTMRPYYDALKVAREDQQGLTDQVKEMFQEAEGSFAKGLWEQWAIILENVKTFFRDNLAAIKAMATEAGSLVVQFGSLVASVGQLGAAILGLRGNFSDTAGFAATMVNLTENLIIRLSAGSQIVSQGVKYVADLLNPSGMSFDELKSSIADIQQGKETQLAESNKQYRDTIDALYGAPKQRPNVLEVRGAAKNPPPENTAKNTQIRQAREAEMQEELSQVKSIAQARMDSAKEEFAQRKINEQQLHDQIIAALRVEKESVDTVIKAYEDFVQKDTSLTPLQKKAAVSKAESLRIRTDASLDHQASQADVTLTDQEWAGEKARMQEKIATQRQMAQQEIDLAKETGATHQEVARMEMAADQREFSERVSLMAAEIDRIQADNEQKKTLQQQLADYITSLHAKLANDQQRIVGGQIEDEYQQIKHTYDAQREQISAQQEQVQLYGQVGTSARDYAQAQAHLAQQLAQVTQQEALNLKAQLDKAIALNANVQEINKLTDAYHRAAQAASQANQAAVAKQQAADETQNSLTDIFGNGVTQGSQIGKSYQQVLNTKTGKFEMQWSSDSEALIREMNHAFTYFDDAANNLVNAFNKGIGQGIGASAQTAGGLVSGSKDLLHSLFGAASSSFGIAGEALSAVGSVVSIISGVFTAAAKRIGTEIKKAFDQTIQDYQNGSKTLADTIQTVEQERNDAIARLSGKKGGKDQLNQLLPQFDQELAQLRNQQKQILDNFNLMAAQLKLGSGPLADMLSTWQDINQQVKDYIGAGGSAATAQAFLSAQLQKIQKDAIDNLNQGESTAINDAISLNGLLQQRIDLEKQYQTARFGLLTQDAVERRASNAVTVGTQLQQQQQQYQDQLKSINDQISLTQQKVDLEKQVFDIASDTATLQKQSDSLQLQSLQEQLDTLRQYASIAQGIFQTPSGYALSSQLAQQIGAQVGAVNVTINAAGGPVDGRAVGDAVVQAINRNARYGGGSNFQRYNSA